MNLRILKIDILSIKKIITWQFCHKNFLFRTNTESGIDYEMNRYARLKEHIKNYLNEFQNIWH